MQIHTSMLCDFALSVVKAFDIKENWETIFLRLIKGISFLPIQLFFMYPSDMSKWSSWRSFTKYWSRVILHLSHKVRKNWYFFSFCRFAKELYPNIEILIGILETITHQRAPTKDIRCFRIYLGLFQNSSRISQPSAFLKEKLKNTAEKLNRMRWWIKCLFFHTAMELFNNSFNFDRNSAH